MKPISIQLDKLLANPSYEKVRGKLILVADDRSKIILELGPKSVKTLFGPFAEADWRSMERRDVIAFVKPGNETAVYDAKLIPKAERPTTSSGSKKATPKTTGAGSLAIKRWTKYVEGRNVGDPVKLVSMEKGFGFQPEFLRKVLSRLDIKIDEEKREIAFLDFRKLYYFLISPAFKEL